MKWSPVCICAHHIYSAYTSRVGNSQLLELQMSQVKYNTLCLVLYLYYIWSVQNFHVC